MLCRASERSVERLQMKATEYMRRNRYLSYEDGLRHLNLPTLNYRRIRGDVIEVYWDVGPIQCVPKKVSPLNILQ